MPTPGSVVSDYFFFDELSKICGQDKAELWLTTQLNARSFCATASGTPQATSPLTSPRITCTADSNFSPNIKRFSDQSKSFSMGRPVTQNWGVMADGASTFRSRFHSFSHSRKNENKSTYQPWKHWKSYADVHAKTPKLAASMCLSLPRHKEQCEFPSNFSENCDTSESPALGDDVDGSDTKAANAPVDDHPAIIHRVPEPYPTCSTDRPDTLRGGAAGPTSMQLLLRLIKERGGGDGEAASSMGLLFTDAAHTVLDRC